MSGSLAERTFIDTYIVFSFLMAGIIYPVAASWVWGGGWLSVLGFKDFAGSGVVHALGGFGGFIGTYILGARINYFEDQKEKPEQKKLSKNNKPKQKSLKPEILKQTPPYKPLSSS